jgi:peroxiredoxin Q/BCP
VILGASGDSVESHRKFKEKYDLPYTLLADDSHEIARAYGVWQKKSMFGKKYMGIPRTTFIIDPDGRIAKVFDKVNPLGHAADVAETIEALRQRSA